MKGRAHSGSPMGSYLSQSIQMDLQIIAQY